MPRCCKFCVICGGEVLQGLTFARSRLSVNHFDMRFVASISSATKRNRTSNSEWADQQNLDLKPRVRIATARAAATNTMHQNKGFDDQAIRFVVCPLDESNHGRCGVPQLVADAKNKSSILQPPTHLRTAEGTSRPRLPAQTVDEKQTCWWLPAGTFKVYDQGI